MTFNVTRRESLFTIFDEVCAVPSVAPRIDQFKQTRSRQWTGRCPICGDSRSQKFKHSFNIYEYKGNLWVKCYKCAYAQPFMTFLKEINPTAFSALLLQKLKNKRDQNSQDVVAELDNGSHFELLSSETSNEIPMKLFKWLADLPMDHPAREYVQGERLLPDSMLPLVGYSDHYVDLLNFMSVENTSKLVDGPRIVLPIYNRSGGLCGFVGRTLPGDDTNARYLTNMIPNVEQSAAYGMERVDLSADRVWVVEGPFDSLFLPNCVAARSSALHRVAATENLSKDNSVLVFDNEPRNKSVCHLIHQAIVEGWQIVVPNAYDYKDVNDLVKMGVDPLTRFNSRIFRGLRAKLEFDNWKR